MGTALLVLGLGHVGAGQRVARLRKLVELGGGGGPVVRRLLQQPVAREYQRAVRLNPALGQALANLGKLHAGQGRYEDALPPLRRVFQISLGTPRIRALLGGALRRRGDQLAAAGKGDEARALFTEALPLPP